MRASRAAIASCLAALLVAGCSRDHPKGPVAATVNGAAITVAQLDEELKAAEVPDPANPEIRNAALQRMVARRLLAESAREQKLDRAPGSELLKAAALETWEASLAEASAVSKIRQPTAAEVEAYVRQNSQMFAGRRAYLVDRLVLAAKPDPAVAEALEPANTLEAVEAVLRQGKTAYRRGTGELDSLTMPPKLSRQIAALGPGELFVLPEREGLSINRVRASKVQPITGPDAVAMARRRLANERRGKAIGDLMAGLRTAAIVSYGEGFAAPK